MGTSPHTMAHAVKMEAMKVIPTRMADTNGQIDGCPRHLSIHSGGMLITRAPLAEIAGALGRPAGSLKVTLFKIRVRLKECIERKRAAPLQPIAKRGALDERHHVVQQSARITRVE